MNALRWKLVAGLAALLAAAPGVPAQGAEQPQSMPPHLGYLYPAGGRQGATVEVTAGGQFLREVTGVHVWGDGIQVTVGKYAKPLNAEEYFRLQEQFKGLRERFQAERAMVPPGRAQGVYQRLLRELGVTEDDADGNEVAYAEDYRFQPDPVLHYEVPADGRYVLEIQDAMYRGRQDFVYRVTLGEVPFVTDVFPLGARDGAGATVEVKGWNLPLEALTLDASDKGVGIDPISVRKDEQISNRVPFARHALPECMDLEENDRPEKAQEIALPVIVNGRIDRPGDWDVFRFEGRAGSEIVAEVYARRLGAPVDSVLKLSDEAGRLLTVNDDHEDKAAALLTHHADSRLSFRLPSAGTYFLQLGDTQHKGGSEYAYRLRIGPPRPDFELRVVPSSINARAGTNAPITVYALRRDGFDGEITLELKDAPPGFALNAGVLPAHQDKVRLTLAVPPTGGGKPVNLSLRGAAAIKGRKVYRDAVPAEDMIQAFAYHHLVPAKEWLIAVHDRRWANFWWKPAGEDRVLLGAGGTATVRFMAPGGAMAMQTELTLNQPPEGITIQSTSPVRGGVNVVLHADAAKVDSGLEGNLILDASIEWDVDPAEGKPAGSKRRIPIGSLPGIPFQIVGH